MYSCNFNEVNSIPTQQQSPQIATIKTYPYFLFHGTHVSHVSHYQANHRYISFNKMYSMHLNYPKVTAGTATIKQCV